MLILFAGSKKCSRYVYKRGEGIQHTEADFVQTGISRDINI